jgi:homoserine kinase
VAFLEAGGDRDAALWWRSPIPPGRGLGFSGAARVAAAFAARSLAGDDPERARTEAFRVAAELEGHGDNAAASAYGGFVVVAEGTAVPVAVPRGLAVLTWSPASETSTDASRAALPETVTLDDAAFSIARSALWVAALTTGRTELLREASRDRVHQPTRLRARADTAEAVEAMLESPGVLAAWLSGSGPTAAALVDTSVTFDVMNIDMPPSVQGSWRRLEIDHHGVIET